MGARIVTYNVTVVDDQFVFTKGDNNSESDPVAIDTIHMTTGTIYRFDLTGSSAIPQLSISEDGTHTDTDGEGTMGVPDNDAVTFYLDGTALADIEDGASAAAQMATGLALGAKSDENPGGFESLYFDVDADAFAQQTMYMFGADSEGMGCAFKRMLKSMGTISAGPSYRAADGGEHHKAAPAQRLAKKGAVRSAALQRGEALAALDENTTKGTKRGSNNSGHPPLAGGETVGGGAKGHSN